MTGKEALTLVDTLLQAANVGRRLNDIESVVLQETWAGHSYQEIAQQLGYQYDYIKQVGSQLWRSLSQSVGEKVSKRNLQAVLRRYQQSQKSESSSSAVNSTHCTQDWGEAIDVSQIYDQKAELQTLETWILEDGCRVIGIFGLDGIGKTGLPVKPAQHAQSQFDCVIWRSFQQALPLELILSEILPVLAGSQITTDSSINTLMKQLPSKRCLLVLDNIESILQDGNN